MFFYYFIRIRTLCDYKPTKTNHVDNAGMYTSDKFLNLSTINKVHLKWDDIDGSVVNGLRQPALFSFILNKPGYKVSSQPEKIH